MPSTLSSNINHAHTRIPFPTTQQRSSLICCTDRSARGQLVWNTSMRLPAEPTLGKPAAAAAIPCWRMCSSCGMKRARPSICAHLDTGHPLSLQLCNADIAGSPLPVASLRKEKCSLPHPAPSTRPEYAQCSVQQMQAGHGEAVPMNMLR